MQHEHLTKTLTAANRTRELLAQFNGAAERLATAKTTFECVTCENKTTEPATWPIVTHSTKTGLCPACFKDTEGWAK